MQQGTQSGPYRSRLRADSNFYLELSFCNEHGLPHSEFLAWDQTDRVKALAFLVEKGQRCAMCGTAEWEWDPDQGGNKRAYEAVEKHCPGCYQKSVVARDSDDRPGMTVELAPTRGRDAAIRHIAQKKAWMKGGGGG